MGRGSLGKHGGREGGGGTAGGFPDGTSSATALGCLLPRLAPRQGHGCQWPLQDGGSPCSSSDWLSPRPLPETELPQGSPWPGQQEGRCPSHRTSEQLGLEHHFQDKLAGCTHVWQSAHTSGGVPLPARVFGRGLLWGTLLVSLLSVRAATLLLVKMGAGALVEGADGKTRPQPKRAGRKDAGTYDQSRGSSQAPRGSQRPTWQPLSLGHTRCFTRDPSPLPAPSHTRILACDPQPCSANTAGCDLHRWFSRCTTAKPSRGTARGSLNVELCPTPGLLREERVHGDGDAGTLQPGWAFMLK